MERLNQLTSTLNVIRQLSNEIITTALPIMKELEETDNDLLDEFLEEVDDFTPEDALALLQNTSLGLVSDAETIKKEIENFSDAVIQGEDAITEGEKEYPFLLQVWYGDMYGDTGITGLQSLVNDLRKQLADVDEDRILEIAIPKVKTE